MIKYLFCLLVLFGSAAAQIGTTTYTPQSSTGGGGCSGSSCTGVVLTAPSAAQHVVNGPSTTLAIDYMASTNVLSNSVNAVISADAQAGSDIAAKISSAWAAGAGTALTPTASVTVELQPGHIYTTSAQVLLAPNLSTPPYIQAPNFDCHGSTIISTYTGTDEAFRIMGQNASNHAADSGWAQNCILKRANDLGPLVRNNGRLGYHFRDTTLEHTSPGTTGIMLYDVLLGNGQSGVPYTEQTFVDNVAYNCSLSNGNDTGIYVHNGTGSDGGHLYNTYTHQRFQDCRKLFHMGPGTNAFGLIFEYQQNNALSGDTWSVLNEGVILSSRYQSNGETTGTGTVVKMETVGDPSVAATDFSSCEILSRTYELTLNATCNTGRTVVGNGAGLYGRLLGGVFNSIENTAFYGTRAPVVYANGDIFSHIHSNADAPGGHGDTDIIACDPASDGKVYDQTRSNCDGILQVHGSGSTPTNPYGQTIAIGKGFFGDRTGNDYPQPGKAFDVNAYQGFRMHVPGGQSYWQDNYYDQATNEFVVRNTVPITTPGQAQVNGYRIDIYNAMGGGTPYTTTMRCSYNGSTASCNFPGSVSAASMTATSLYGATITGQNYKSADGTTGFTGSCTAPQLPQFKNGLMVGCL